MKTKQINKTCSAFHPRLSVTESKEMILKKESDSKFTIWNVKINSWSFMFILRCCNRISQTGCLNSKYAFFRVLQVGISMPPCVAFERVPCSWHSTVMSAPIIILLDINELHELLWMASSKSLYLQNPNAKNR